MADYKRMVSYMYQYENGEKRRNVGYARIEARNGQCKFTLHVQMLGQPDSIFPTYLIHRDHNRTELIYLGDSLLKNQVLDGKHMANEKDIKDSGYGLSDIGGIILFLNADEFFATEWDDQPIVAKEIMEAMKPKPSKVTSKKAKEDNIVVESNPPEDVPKTKEAVKTEDAPKTEEAVKMEDAPKTEEAVKTEDAPKAEEAVKTEGAPKSEEVAKAEDAPKTEEAAMTEDVTKEQVVKVADDVKTKEVIKANRNEIEKMVEDAAVPMYKLPRGWKTVERLQNNPYATWKKIDLPKVQEREPEQDKIKRNVADTRMARKEQENTNRTSATEGNKKESIPIGAMNSDKVNRKEENKENVNKESSNLSVNQRKESSIAVKFFENYPRINPFEDNEIILCVKIEPKDIGLLPKELWGLSNNSFLLHGYYSYRHLIFAKMMDRSGTRYIIGVPGTYHNKEKVIARMFGFDCFKSAKKRELRQGDFGYWYITISI